MKISEISTIFGIPNETLRYIERQGLVHPTRTKDGSYREYDMNAFGELLEYMKYRHIGMSVKSIIEFSENGSVQYLTEEMEVLQKQLLKDISEKELLVGFLKDYIEKLNAMNINRGMFWFKKIFPCSYVDIGVVGNVKDTYHHSELATAWRQHVPFVELSTLYEADDMLEYPCVLVAEDRYISCLPLPVDEHVGHMPGGLALCTYSSVEDIKNTIRQGMEILKLRNYCLNGSIRANMLYLYNQKAGLEVLFPVKAIE